MSIDRIKAELEREASEGKWKKAPSRGAIQNIVYNWESLPEEIRFRDLPFVWHEIEKARIPWEASRYVLECQAGIERGIAEYATELAINHMPPEEVTSALANAGAFTNRWATWVWRVHQARPDWEPGRVYSVAALYVYSEQAQDILPDHPSIYPRGFQALLAHQADRWDETQQKTEGKTGEETEKEAQENKARGIFYLYAIEFGIVEPLPSTEELEALVGAWQSIPNIGSLEAVGGKATVIGLGMWLDSWRWPLNGYFTELASKKSEGNDHARTSEEAISE